jgi:hypothetical protein
MYMGRWFSCGSLRGSTTPIYSPNDQQPSQNTPAGTLVRPSVPNASVGNTCSNCGETGHCQQLPQEKRSKHSSAESTDEEWKQDPAELQGTTKLCTWFIEPHKCTDRVRYVFINTIPTLILSYHSQNLSLSIRISRTRIF